MKHAAVPAAERVPSPERVLRALFWKLLFYGRTAQHAQSHRKHQRRSVAWQMVAYGALGLLPAIVAFQVDTLAYASLLHAYTLLFASLTLASSAGTMLFVREEAEILLHRPVRPEELLRAKAFALILFSLLLAGALNAIGLFTGIWSRGSSWLFLPAHALATVLLMLFSAAMIVLVYNLCLRWFGRERLDNLLTLVQMLMTLVMIAGSQLMPRFLGSDMFTQFDPSRSWALLLPPVWFGALDAVLCGGAPFERAFLPATLAVAATSLVTWLAFVRLGSAYGTGLVTLNENQAPVRERRGARLLPRLLAAPPLRWWLRDGVERQAFLLSSAYLVRDRETKLKIMPSLVPMLVLPIVMAFGPSGRRDEGPAVWLDSISMGYCAIVPIQALLLLRRSEQWRAAEVFRIAPLAHWAPLFHGARKAVLVWLCAPIVILIASLLAAIRGSALPFLLVLPSLAVLPSCAMIPGLFKPWLPLSQPNQEVRDSSVGCLVFGAVMFGAMAIGALGALMQTLGWFWPFLLLVTAMGFCLQTVFGRWIQAKKWRPAGDD